MTKKEQKTYAIAGAVLIGGYLLLRRKEAKEKAAFQTVTSAPGGVFSLVSSIGKTITAGISSLATPTVVLSQPAVQQYKKTSTYDPEASQVQFEKGVSGYYGSLGAVGSRYGSLG